MTNQQRPSPVVLVVDDEEILCSLAVALVEDAGFQAVEAANADQAMAILEKRPDITMLFTDVNMPGSMNGLKLAHAVRNRWPPIKILIVSGHVDLRGGDIPTHSRFFRKPYQPEMVISELVSMVG
jgi:two-component system, response regulator PdtaR